MTDSYNSDILQLNIDSILRERLSSRYRYIPKSIVRWLEKTICQDEMNLMLRNNHGLSGADFCSGVLKDLNITYEIKGIENMPSDPRALFISNHPLGGLDGIILIDFVASVYGPSLKFLVNDLLMAVKPLENVFLPVNKHGAQSREASIAVEEALAGKDPVLVFPAGLCSRSNNGKISDLKWQKTFVNKAIRYRRPIVPIHFSGRNSDSFYRFAKLRERSGIKFNIEMIYLPREVFRKRNCKFTVTIGSPIDYTDIKGGLRAQMTADRLKDIVYSLATD